MSQIEVQLSEMIKALGELIGKIERFDGTYGQMADRLNQVDAILGGLSVPSRDPKYIPSHILKSIDMLEDSDTVNQELANFCLEQNKVLTTRVAKFAKLRDFLMEDIKSEFGREITEKYSQSNI